MSPSRAIAFDILLRVGRGGYASDLLLEHTSKLASRDAGLASEIVFGCLRFQKQLDFLIQRYSGRSVIQLDEEVRTPLRMAIYQLRYLDRIPPHAAVQESVELVKRGPKRSAAGFVNAVSRKVDRTAVAWPDRATEVSCPEWLLEKWERQFGSETAGMVARAALMPPQTYIRVPPGRDLPEEAIAEATTIPGCFRVKSSAPGFRIQDIGSQSIVPLLELEPGQTLLDLCAAPGNKTAQALESNIEAVACDLRLSRLRMLDGLACHRVVLDGTKPLPFLKLYDRILVDAPCSGTGTLSRNPEIKWRIQASDLAEQQVRQIAILRNALGQLAPGGRLVYATCSLEAEENDHIVDEILRGAGARARLIRKELRLPGVAPGDGFFAAVITSN